MRAGSVQVQHPDPEQIFAQGIGQLAGTFGVNSIPTLVVIKEGKITNHAVGARPKAQILEML